MPDQAPTITIENARIIYRNFAGNPTTFNPKGGARTFNVILDPDTAKQMESDGWNVKWPEARNPEEEESPRDPHIQVAVRFDVFPPKITVITESSRTLYTEEMVAALDWAEIQNIDLILRGHLWEVNGKSGLKAYLKTMFVTIDEDELERKYAVTE